MFIYHTLFILSIVLLVVNSAVIERVKNKENEKRSNPFGIDENFVNKVDKAKIVRGHGSVHTDSEKVSVEHDKKELIKMLRVIYDNFVESNDDSLDNIKVKDPPKPPTTTARPAMTARPATTAHPVDFKALENAVDDLIKSLSIGKDQKQDSKMFSQFGEVNSGEDLPPHVEVVAKKDASGKIESDGFAEFKQKFFNNFLKSSENQRDNQKHIFIGKKKSKDQFKNENLRELYHELKKEVQDEKRKVVIKEKEKKVASETTNTMEAKKKELVSLINNLLGEKKYVYDGQKMMEKNKKSDDEEFERLYARGDTSNSKKSTVEKKKPKTVEKIFMDAFKRGLKDDLSNKVEDKDAVIDLNKKKEVEAQTKAINDYIKDQRKKLLEERQKKAENTQQEKKEKLRGYLIDLIKTLDKRNIQNKDAGKKSKSEHDANEFEKELEDVVNNKGNAKEVTPGEDINEALKGFEFASRNTKKKVGTSRP